MVYACQRVGRASILKFVFCACVVDFSPIKGRCFRGISIIGGGAFGGYMSEGFNDWGGRAYDDIVLGEVIKIAPSGDETT